MPGSLGGRRILITGASSGIGERIGKVLEAADIANAVVYALAQPEHVSINEILVRPTRQSR